MSMQFGVVQLLLARAVLDEQAKEPFDSNNAADARRALDPSCLARRARAPRTSDSRAVDAADLWLEMESIRRDSVEHLANIKSAISRLKFRWSSRLKESG